MKKTKRNDMYIVTCFFDEEQTYEYCDSLKEVEECIADMIRSGEIINNISIFKGSLCEFDFKVVMK